MSQKLREENKTLRSENDLLRDEILSLKEQLRDANRVNDRRPSEKPISSVDDYSMAPTRQDSGSGAPS